MWNIPSKVRQCTNTYKQHHVHKERTPTAEVLEISLLSILCKDALNLLDYTKSVMDKRIRSIDGMIMTVENEDYYLKPAFCILILIK